MCLISFYETLFLDFFSYAPLVLALVVVPVACGTCRTFGDAFLLSTVAQSGYSDQRSLPVSSGRSPFPSTELLLVGCFRFDVKRLFCICESFMHCSADTWLDVCMKEQGDGCSYYRGQTPGRKWFGAITVLGFFRRRNKGSWALVSFNPGLFETQEESRVCVCVCCRRWGDVEGMQSPTGEDRTPGTRRNSDPQTRAQNFHTDECFLFFFFFVNFSLSYVSISMLFFSRFSSTHVHRFPKYLIGWTYTGIKYGLRSSRGSADKLLGYWWEGLGF